MTDLKLPSWQDFDAAAERHKMSVAALCRRADIDQSVFTRWKAGKIPSGRVIENLIEAVRRLDAAASLNGGGK